MAPREREKVTYGYRLRIDGCFSSAEEESKIIGTKYREVTHKDGKVSVRRPDGRFSSSREQNIYREYREKVFAPTPTPTPLTPTEVEPDLTDFDRGKFLRRLYYFNFWCTCKVADDDDTPETFITPTGERMVQHNYGFSTNHFHDLNEVTQRALVAHNRHYPRHKNKSFELTQKKVMTL